MSSAHVLTFLTLNMKLGAVPGVQACLRVNGAQLEEYAAEEDDDGNDPKGMKWVEATSNSTFTVFFKSNAFQLNGDPGKDSIVCAIYLDGKWVSSSVLDVYRTPYIPLTCWAIMALSTGNMCCRGSPLPG